MPVRLYKVERYPGVDRQRFALAVLQYCRALRHQPKMRSARFYWADANTAGLILEGETGCFNETDEQDPELAQANFALADLCSLRMVETWADAGRSERSWERAGRPSGTT